MLVFTDVETTGLDVRHDLLLEVAFVITTDDLEVVDQWSRVLSHRPEQIDIIIEMGQVAGVVVEMHEKNGLWDEVKKRGGSVPDAVTVDEEAVARLHRACEKLDAKLSETPLAGSNVSFDRTFLRSWYPALEASFHYRILDVSSIKEAVKRWRPKVYAAWKEKAGKDKPHRALPDALESVAELRHYKEALFRGCPSPISLMGDPHF